MAVKICLHPGSYCRQPLWGNLICILISLREAVPVLPGPDVSVTGQDHLPGLGWRGRVGSGGEQGPGQCSSVKPGYSSPSTACPNSAQRHAATYNYCHSLIYHPQVAQALLSKQILQRILSFRGCRPLLLLQGMHLSEELNLISISDVQNKLGGLFKLREEGNGIIQTQRHA